MLRKTMFLLTIAILATAICDAEEGAARPAPYTVVLKTGKTVKGTLVSEDDSMYQLRDADRIVITVKKSTVDLDATAKANVPAPAANETPVVEKKEATTPEAPKRPLAISREKAEALYKKYQDRTVSDSADSDSDSDADSASGDISDLAKTEEKMQNAELNAKKAAEDRESKIAYCEQTKPDFSKAWVTNQVPGADGTTAYPTGPSPEQQAEMDRWHKECDPVMSGNQ